MWIYAQVQICNTTFVGIRWSLKFATLRQHSYLILMPPRHALQLTLLPQLIEQHLGLLEVGRAKPLGEPAVDFREQLVGFSLLALPLP